MNLRWTLRGLRWSYCAFIAAASLVAVRSALQGHDEGSHGAQTILALAMTEAIAAIALAIKPAEIVACIALLLVYSVAAVMSILSAEWLAVLRFTFYGVTAAYIVLTSRANECAARTAT
jgi:hypothetical protein